MESYVLIYLLAANVAAFLVFGIDKWKAVKGRWRIPEKTLLLFAAAGGSPGALAGMFVFHHKIRKPLFYLGVPLILLRLVLGSGSGRGSDKQQTQIVLLLLCV